MVASIVVAALDIVVVKTLAVLEKMDGVVSEITVIVQLLESKI